MVIPEYRVCITEKIKTSVYDIKFLQFPKRCQIDVFLKFGYVHFLVTDTAPLAPRRADAILMAEFHRRANPRRLGAASQSIRAEPHPLCVKEC